MGSWVKAVAVVVLGAALGSCAAALPPSAVMPAAHEQVAIEAAVQSWRMARLPWSPMCDEQFERVRVVTTGPEEFTELCGRRPVHGGGKLYACNTEQYEMAFPFWLMDYDRVPLLVISELQPPDHRRVLVIHESMHWLERCSGKGVDFDHEDGRVWQGARMVAQRIMHATDARTRVAAR